MQDMPRLSVDIDVVYRPWQSPREDALEAIEAELASISGRVVAPRPADATRSQE
jgi:hypothetical protein